jgi:hypothetical protein
LQVVAVRSLKRALAAVHRHHQEQTAMSTFKAMKRLVLMIATLGAALTADVERAEACKCLPPTVESSYNNSSDVVRARVLSKVQAGDTTRFRARVQRTFKGCLTPSQIVVLTTPSSSATCGAQLQVGGSYLIHGDAAGSYLGLSQLAINSCDFNRLFASLTAHDRAFLDGRTVCCGARCTCADGTRPVNCFVDPCQVAPECPEGECVANYCGGCNAEFYDESGFAVCQERTCQSEADCAGSEYCASGSVCAGDGQCEHDVDCNLPGNDYPHIECVGHGICDQASGRCGWTCGEPQCLDRAGFNFGPCDAVLGVVVLDGRCVEVSGCSADPFGVFASVAECERACGLTGACTPGETTPPDACGNVCSCASGGQWVCTQRPCFSE